MPDSDFDIFSDLFEPEGSGKVNAHAPATAVLPAEAGTRVAEVPEKKRRRGLKITLWVIAGVLVAVLGLVTYFGLRFANSMNDAPTMTDEEAFAEESLRPAPYTPPAKTKGTGEGEGEAEVAEEEVWEGPDPVNILLLGSDSRGDSGTDFDHLGDRSDVIMVAHVTPDRKTVEVMSIMRDSWVNIPGYGYDKINSALAKGGVPLLTLTVETLIDQRIDHVAIIDFEGFKGLTDALGGVTVYNEREFTANQHGLGFYFPAGDVPLDGEEALAYVRERYAFNDGDYQRVRNQRAYLNGVMNKTLSWEVLSNPAKLASTMEAFAPYINRTSGLNPTTLAALGIEMGGMPQIKMFTMPTTGVGTEGVQSVVYLNWDGVEQVRWAFKQASLQDWTPPGPYG